jgi:hypothetical protein
MRKLIWFVVFFLGAGIAAFIVVFLATLGNVQAACGTGIGTGFACGIMSLWQNI